MKRKIGGFLLIIGSVFAFSSINAEESSYFAPGSLSNRPIEYKNLREGFMLFKSNCKSCHTQENDKNAPFLCANSKTMDGWNRLFARENSIAEKQGCLNGFSKEELMDLNDYLYTYASDGSKPDDELGCP
jgi:mono/diheme cytochrome c family protein